MVHHVSCLTSQRLLAEGDWHYAVKTASDTLKDICLIFVAFELRFMYFKDKTNL